MITVHLSTPGEKKKEKITSFILKNPRLKIPNDELSLPGLKDVE